MKRVFDLIAATFLLFLFFIPLLILSLIIRCKLGSPIFFYQMRPGLNGRPFKMVKFRTMTNQIDLDGSLLEDKHRVTSLGSFLRATSIDELPELWNVLCGDMSLVGPRPLLMNYLSLYTNEQSRRHDVRPGITGWAQVNGRNTISWEERFKLDVWYVDNHNLWLDFKILCLTARKVFLREGISAVGEVTMPPFKGSEVER